MQYDCSPLGEHVPAAGAHLPELSSFFTFMCYGRFFFKPLLVGMADRDVGAPWAHKVFRIGPKLPLGRRSKHYQEALRQARGQVYAEQEAALKKLLDERAAEIKKRRTTDAGEVGAAKVRVRRNLAAARREVEKHLCATFPRKLRAASSKLRRVPGAPARELDDAKAPFFLPSFPRRK